jgi:glyoxalase-like protein
MLLQELLARVDHLVYATCELDRGVAEIEQFLGVRASLGGRHPTWGTRNALVALGPRCYLEIIAPDPEHSARVGARPFGLDGFGSSRLVGWAANATKLEQLRAQASRQGVTLGDVQPGSRQRPDGTILSWTLTDLCCVVADGIMPFFIDWGQSPHPASAAPVGAMLVSLHAEHPEANQVSEMLRGFGLQLPVKVGSAPALVAEINCPKGRVLLR